ncbi:MAG TPA: GNAT family N-acetyltransferase [Planctomycetota bacterium]|nr:GNAT family N-acetyltransferase [Planctomycetota bacterium]
MIEDIASNPHTELSVRSLEPGDLAGVVALDTVLTGTTKQGYWEGVFERVLRDESSIGLVLEGIGGLEGYLFGEIRAFEFGSDECGWILALGVRPETTRKKRASALLEEAKVRFCKLGVSSLRTMVTRTDIPFLSLFRRHGFVGGPYVQLELDIGEDTE